MIWSAQPYFAFQKGLKTAFIGLRTTKIAWSILDKPNTFKPAVVVRFANFLANTGVASL